MPKVCPVCGTNYPDTNIFCPADGSTLRAADTDADLIGSVIADRYLITDLLGEGGMGRVFLARHVRLPLQAAIKVLRPELLKDPAAVARFNREAANASSIEHERVARVFDFGETPDGSVYLAMEYVAGPTLKQLISSGGPLGLQRTAEIVRQVAEGLDAAHRMGIVHRDLKPDNILVQHDDLTGDRCKVVDFGIAKAVGGDSGESGLTKTGFVVGTPEFMSPEQLLGGEIDQRSDVYALALVAYQCLTQDLPFDRETPDKGMTARLTSEPRPLALVRPDMPWPTDLQEVLNRALQREPAKRTEAAGIFARQFQLAAKAPETASSAGAPPKSTDSFAPGVGEPRYSTDYSSATQSVIDPAAQATSGLPESPITRSSESSTSDALVPDSRPAFRLTSSPRSAASIAVLLLMLVAGGWWVMGGSSTATENGDEAGARGPGDTVVSVPHANTVDTSTSVSSSTSSVVSSDTSSETAPSARIDPRRSASESRGSSATSPPSGASISGSTRSSGSERSPVGAADRNNAITILDSITRALDPKTIDERAAHAAVPALRALLPRLTNASDSTWAYIRIAESYFFADEVRPACAALRSARSTARSMLHAEIINGYTGQWGCDS